MLVKSFASKAEGTTVNNNGDDQKNEPTICLLSRVQSTKPKPKPTVTLKLTLNLLGLKPKKVLSLGLSLGLGL